jgi:hypothetical protein
MASENPICEKAGIFPLKLFNGSRIEAKTLRTLIFLTKLGAVKASC